MAYINLDYLESMADGDAEVIREMKELFISQVPEFINNLNKHLNDKNYSDLGKEAHKAKSSVMIMGMEELARDLKALQLMTISGIETDSYPAYVKKFEEQCLAAVEELKKENTDR